MKIPAIGARRVAGLIDGARPRPGDEFGRSQLGHLEEFRVNLADGDGSTYKVRLNPENGFPLTPTTFTLFFVGDRFNVRYLPRSPQHFVIITDDNSPWAIRERCYHLASEIEYLDRHPEEYDAPAALKQSDRQRYKNENCKAIVVLGRPAGPGSDDLENIGKLIGLHHPRFDEKPRMP